MEQCFDPTKHNKFSYVWLRYQADVVLRLLLRDDADQRRMTKDLARSRSEELPILKLSSCTLSFARNWQVDTRRLEMRRVGDGDDGSMRQIQDVTSGHGTQLFKLTELKNK